MNTRCTLMNSLMMDLKMKKPANILIVDDDQDILVASKLLLQRKFSDVSVCNTPDQLPKLLSEQDYDVILLDMNFGPGESSGEQGFYWLGQILTLKPESIVIMITAHGGVDVAVEAIKLGATDFIAKPWHNEKVVATVSTALALNNTRKEAQSLKATNQALVQASTGDAQNIIGSSTAMQGVHQLIAKAAPTDANILILGENGTGKELVARAIHQQSKRAQQVFMSVDLGAISETLFESELFGHKKGAFTGAQQDRVGLFQAANGGTLFLDEIGNLPLHLQAKLLTALEQRQVIPVGSNKPISIDVRVISATNVDKTKLSEETAFRQDLLFRLNTVELHLPALRERPEDIVEIAEHYLNQYGRKYGKPGLTLSHQSQQALQAYEWRGNVRALRHAVERAVILSNKTELSIEDFQLEAPSKTVVEAPTKKVETDGMTLDEIERSAIEQSLRKNKYNISHTAKALGLTRAALYRRMEKHGL